MEQRQPETFGVLLRRHRLGRGWTQAQLAEQAAMSVDAVSTLERGTRRAPYPGTVARLADALGLSAEERASFTAAGSDERNQTDVAVPISPPTNLPDDPTRFIGREREVEQIAALLRDPHIRLVTITGVGGSGKTRLALRVGRSLLPDFPDGVFVVNLASIPDPTRVPAAIAEDLSVGHYVGLDPLKSLVTALKERRLLLILDNYEHLLPAGSVAATLLDRCPELHLLITSRIPLHLSRGHDYEVLPLSVPDPAAVSKVSDVASYESVALFADRARAVMADFQVTNDSVLAVAEICVRLDGLPLALELAAARIKLFPPPALLQRLSSRLEILTGGARDAPERQRTLRRTLDWSYSLLAPSEQMLLARLSVFAGGCTLGAAQAVCDPEGEMDLLGGLTALVDHSLVQQTGTDEPRFDMLETIREYSAEKLSGTDQPEAIARRHAEYYAAYMEHFDYDATRTPASIRTMQKERDNLLAALTWLRDREDFLLGLRLVGAIRGREPVIGLDIRPWLAVFRPVLPQAPPSIRAKVMLAEAGIVIADESLGARNYNSSEVVSAVRQIHEALALFRQESDPWVRVRGLIAGASGLAYTPLGSFEGAMEAAEQAFSESLALARSIGSLIAEAGALRGLGHTAISLHHDQEASENFLRQSLEVERRVGNVMGVADSLWPLAGMAWEKGDRLRAIDLLSASIAEQLKAGVRLDHRQYMFAFRNLELGDYERVPQIFRDGRGSGWFYDRDEQSRSWVVLLAASAAVSGDLERAARLFASVSPAWGDEFRSTAARFEPDFQKYRASVREQLGEAAWAALWEEGQAMTLEEALSYALQESDYAPAGPPRP